MHRRQVLKLAGTAIAGIAGAGVASADGDADPRPEPQGGTQPNGNVPTVETGALGFPPFNEPGEISTGNWILHDNGWVFNGNPDKVREFADATTQTYVIDGEEFVLDSYDDWDHWVEDDGTPHITFDYVTPPKPRGKTYEVRWEFEWDDDPHEAFPNWENVFPLSNQIEIVGGR